MKASAPAEPAKATDPNLAGATLFLKTASRDLDPEMQKHRQLLKWIVFRLYK